jgi:hypothetical protein
MSFTREQKRIKIAEACGWKGIVPQFAIGYAPWRPKSYSEACMGDLDSIPQDPIPDYCNDLNAMHEAEKLLKSEQHFTFQVELARVINTTTYPLNFALLHATAAQRAEAFGLTLNLWNPGE